MKRRTGKKTFVTEQSLSLGSSNVHDCPKTFSLPFSFISYVLSLTVCVPSIFSPRTYDSDPTLLNYTTMTWGKDEEKQRARNGAGQREKKREKIERGRRDGKVGGRTRDPNGLIACKVKIGIGRKKNITFPFLREKQNRKNSIQKTELLFLLCFPRCFILLSISLSFSISLFPSTSWVFLGKRNGRKEEVKWIGDRLNKLEDGKSMPVVEG